MGIFRRLIYATKPVEPEDDNMETEDDKTKAQDDIKEFLTHHTKVSLSSFGLP